MYVRVNFTFTELGESYSYNVGDLEAVLYASVIQGSSGPYTDFGLLDGEFAGTIDGFARAGQVMELDGGPLEWPSGLPTRYGLM